MKLSEYIAASIAPRQMASGPTRKAQLAHSRAHYLAHRASEKVLARGISADFWESTLPPAPGAWHVVTVKARPEALRPATVKAKRKAKAAVKAKRKANAAPVLGRDAAMSLAIDAIAGNFDKLRGLASGDRDRGTWGFYASKLLKWIEAGMPGRPPFKIFAKGNSKLPFSAFSALPLVTCPGAGACGKFCYSFRAWRYPAAFMRQLMNTILLQTEAGKAILAKAFMRLPGGKLRLFVDGDFANVDQVFFFMGLIAARPDLRVYGYSKSWTELLAAQLRGINWPANYLLNLSSGSAHGEGLRNAVAGLPIARGEFIARTVAAEHIKNRAYQGRARAGFPAYRKAIQDAMPGERIFVCPGKCGSCLPGGEHACGSEKFRGVKIVIGVH